MTVTQTVIGSVTTTPSATASSKSDHTGAIIGGAVGGGVGLLLLLGLLGLCLWRQRRDRQLRAEQDAFAAQRDTGILDLDDAAEPTPFPVSGGITTAPMSQNASYNVSRQPSMAPSAFTARTNNTQISAYSQGSATTAGIAGFGTGAAIAAYTAQQQPYPYHDNEGYGHAPGYEEGLVNTQGAYPPTGQPLPTTAQPLSGKALEAAQESSHSAGAASNEPLQMPYVHNDAGMYAQNEEAEAQVGSSELPPTYGSIRNQE